MSASRSAPAPAPAAPAKKRPLIPGTELNDVINNMSQETKDQILKGYENANAEKPADWDEHTEPTDVGMIDDQPTLFECKLWGASAALISKPHSTDGGVPLWRMNMMAKSGMFPNLAHAMENMVGRVYMHTKQLKIPMTVMSLLCSDFPAQRSEEWYAARRGFLTASEVSSVLGTCKYRTSEELMRAKIDRTQIPDNPAMAHGRGYEDEALDLFVQVRSAFRLTIG